jgi:hypothetical protein
MGLSWISALPPWLLTRETALLLVGGFVVGIFSVIIGGGLSLCLSRSPFPGNGISGPEKNAQKRPADCNDAVSENDPSHRSPPIRGLSYTFRKSPVALDCVVGSGAVTHANLVNGLRVKQFQKAL